MKFRIVDATLLVASIVGAAAAVSSARQLHELQREDARLTGTLGELVITDPALLHVQALETGEPLHFAWRVYAPAGKLTVSDFDSGGNNPTQSFDGDSKPRQYVARIRFIEQGAGQVGVFRLFNQREGFSRFDSPELFEFVRNHWNELDIEQLGAHGAAKLKSGEAATVLRVSLPQRLLDKAREQKLAIPSSRGVTPPVFECRLNWN